MFGFPLRIDAFYITNLRWINAMGETYYVIRVKWNLFQKNEIEADKSGWFKKVLYSPCLHINVKYFFVFGLYIFILLWNCKLIYDVI